MCGHLICTSMLFTFDVCLQVYPSPATSLAYSGDDRIVAVGYQNGVLKLWKGLQCFASRGTVFKILTSTVVETQYLSLSMTQRDSEH